MNVKNLKATKWAAYGAALALGLFGFALVGSLQPVQAGLFNPNVFTLENGMQVVVIEDHRAPVVTQMVWYKIGAADEPEGKSGVAHFLEHLLFKGTKDAPGNTFSKMVAASGGRENAFTSHDFTGYFQTVAADRLPAMMRLEADRMVNLVLTEKDVATERNVILEERRSRTENDPSSLLSEQMAAAQFLALPYRNPVIGWKHEIEQLNRADALAFYRQYYAPNNAILIVAGDVATADVKRLAEKYYGVIPPSKDIARRRPSEPPQIAARRIEYRDERVRQPSWRRTYTAPSSMAGETQHALPLDMLADILGGGTTSRLYQALVVEQKIAASAGAWYSSTAIDLGRFGLYGQPVNGGGVAKIEAAIDAEIAKIIEHGVTPKELDRSKAGMIAAATYARDSVSGTARIFGRSLVIGRTVEDVESWPERVARVTPEQVRAAARYVFDIRRSVTGLLLPKKAG